MKRFYIYIFFLAFICNSSIIPVPLIDKKEYQHHKNRLYLKLTGDYEIFLDSDSQISSLYPIPFYSSNTQDKVEPKIIGKEEIKTRVGEFSGTLFYYSSSMKIFNLNTPVYLEFSYFNSQHGIKGEYLSLAPKYHNSNYSIINQLHKGGLISNKKFALDLSNQKDKEWIYLGGIPEDLQKQITKSKVVKLDGDGLSSEIALLIGNVQYGNSLKTKFVLSSKTILLTSRVFTTIISNIFQKYIDDGSCKVKQLLYATLYCKKNVIDQIPPLNISFIHHFNNIELKKESLFDCEEEENDMCAFTIQSKGMFGPNQWEIGYALFKDYVTEFDYENLTLTFHDKGNEVKYLRRNFGGKNSKLKLFRYFSILLIVMILVLCAVKINGRNLF